MLKNSIVGVLSAAGLVSLTVSAEAQDTGFYVDGGYTFIGFDVEDSGISADFDLGAVTGRGGYNFSKHFGIEAEAAIGVEDEEATSGGITASLGLNYLVGAYGKASLPVSDRIGLHARAGIIQAELEAEVTGFGSESDDDTGFAYGIGGTANITESLYARADYTIYDFDGGEADGFFVGIGAKF